MHLLQKETLWLYLLKLYRTPTRAPRTWTMILKPYLEFQVDWQFGLRDFGFAN